MRKSKLSFRQRILVQIAMFVMLDVVTTVYAVSDLALSFFKPETGRLPYGVLWTWLNPLYWTQWEYRIYLLAFQLGMMWIQYKLVLKKKLQENIFYWNQYTQVFWRTSHVLQNITVIAFAPLASIFPPLILLEVFQKLPIGFPLGDEHWKCASFNGYPDYNIQVEGKTMYLCPAKDFIHWMWYIILIFWIAYPLYVWGRNHGLKKWIIK